LDLIHNKQNLYLLVLLASLMGNLHCAGTKTPFSVILYHLGRLFGYLFLGIIAYFIGYTILTDFIGGFFSYIATIAIGLYLVILGFQILIKKNRYSFHLKLPKKLENFLSTLLSKVVKLKSSFLVGSLSVLLPCGWLYSFVLFATTSKTIMQALLIMLFFWIGTLPALLITSHLKLKLKFKSQITSIIFILLGIFTITYKSTKNDIFNKFNNLNQIILEQNHCVKK